MNRTVLLPLFLTTLLVASTATAAGRRVAPSDVIQIHILNQPELDTQVGSRLTAQSRFLMSDGFEQPD